MKSRLKIQILTLGIFSQVFLITVCKKEQEVVIPSVQVNVVKAVQNDVPLFEDFVAQVYGESDVDIRARVEGWVTSVNFQEGSTIKKGQLLYTIDDIEYKNKLDQQASQVTRARTELVRAESELSRVRPLTGMNALSKKDLDNAVAERAYVSSIQSSLEKIFGEIV